MICLYKEISDGVCLGPVVLVKRFLLESRKLTDNKI